MGLCEALLLRGSGLSAKDAIQPPSSSVLSAVVPLMRPSAALFGTRGKSLGVALRIAAGGGDSCATCER
jgi:hypothetical protein